MDNENLPPKNDSGSKDKAPVPHKVNFDSLDSKAANVDTLASKTSRVFESLKNAVKFDFNHIKTDVESTQLEEHKPTKITDLTDLDASSTGDVPTSDGRSKPLIATLFGKIGQVLSLEQLVSVGKYFGQSNADRFTTLHSDATGSDDGSRTFSDQGIRITINDIFISETGETATFSVVLLGIITEPVTFGFFTSDGTATSDISVQTPPDYDSVTGRAVFLPTGAASQIITIEVPINDDTLLEGNESFSIELVLPDNTTVNASASKLKGIGTIIDNEVPQEVSIENTNVREGELASFIIRVNYPSDKIQ